MTSPMPGKLRSPSTIFILLSLKACHVFVCFQAIQGRVSIYKRKMVLLLFFFFFLQYELPRDKTLTNFEGLLLH